MQVDHYMHGECETVDFVELVLSQLDVEPEQYWAIGSALKYACRAGYKGNWQADAFKCADFLNRALTGHFLQEKKLKIQPQTTTLEEHTVPEKHVYNLETKRWD